MPLVTATFTTGGNVVITDTVEQALITTLTTAVNANTLAINTTMGTLGAATPGNVSTSMAVQASMLADTVTALGKIEENQRKIILALDRVSASIETNTKGVAAMASSLKNIDIMATTVAADQIKNNKFQQKATNAAREKAGDPPIVVKEEELKETMTGTLQDMRSMTSIQLIYKTIDKAGEMLTEGAKWSLQWAAETEVGLFFTSKFAQGEALIVGLFSKEKADQILREADAKIAKIKAGAV